MGTLRRTENYHNFVHMERKFEGYVSKSDNKTIFFFLNVNFYTSFMN